MLQVPPAHEGPPTWVPSTPARGGGGGVGRLLTLEPNDGAAAGSSGTRGSPAAAAAASFLAAPAFISGGGGGSRCSGPRRAASRHGPARPGMGSAHSVPAEMRELADRTGCKYRPPRVPGATSAVRPPRGGTCHPGRDAGMSPGDEGMKILFFGGGGAAMSPPGLHPRCYPGGVSSVHTCELQQRFCPPTLLVQEIVPTLRWFAQEPPAPLPSVCPSICPSGDALGADTVRNAWRGWGGGLQQGRGLELQTGLGA